MEGALKEIPLPRNFIAPMAISENVDAMEEPISIEEQIRLARDDETLEEEERAELIANLLILQYGWLIGEDIGNLPYEARFLAEEIMASIMARQRARNFAPIQLNVPPIRQQMNNWCGPATALQTVSFINRPAVNTLTQQTLASRMNIAPGGGTDLAVVSREINNFRGSARAYSAPATLTTITAINSNIMAAMHTNRSPIIRIETPAVANWPYSIGSGHFLNVSGVQPTLDGMTANTIRLTDPWFYSHWIPSRPTANGTYWVTLSQLNSAMTIGRGLPNFSS